MANEQVTDQTRTSWIRLLARVVSDPAFRDLVKSDLQKALAEYEIKTDRPEEFIKQLTPTIEDALRLADVLSKQPQSGAPTQCYGTATYQCIVSTAGGQGMNSGPVSGKCWGSAGTVGSAGTFGGSAGTVGTGACYGCAGDKMMAMGGGLPTVATMACPPTTGCPATAPCVGSIAAQGQGPSSGACAGTLGSYGGTAGTFGSLGGGAMGGPMSGKCSGTFGTAGCVGTVGGCAGSAGTVGSYGSAGVMMASAFGPGPSGGGATGTTASYCDPCAGTSYSTGVPCW